MKKTITIIIVVLVIAAAGVGGFFYFKKILLRYFPIFQTDCDHMATQQAILSMEGYSANIMTKYILPTLTITTNYML